MKVTWSSETSAINLSATRRHTKTRPSSPKNRNGKVYLPCTVHAIKTYEGAEVQLHPFLTLTLIGDKSPLHVSAVLPPEKEPSVLAAQVVLCTAEHASTKGRIF
jgi:succinate dehydrogenase/fumarate reductase flavoprotein subunit